MIVANQTVVFTDHARRQMRRRCISSTDVHAVLRDPDTRYDCENGNHASVKSLSDGRRLKVITARGGYSRVITVYDQNAPG